MKKIILAAALATMFSGGAFAQTTGPAGQDTNKAGMAPSTEMNKGTTTGGMTSGTTGMSKDGMAKDGMSKDGMAKDGMAKDGMAKDGMKK